MRANLLTSVCTAIQDLQLSPTPASNIMTGWLGLRGGPRTLRYSERVPMETAPAAVPLFHSIVGVAIVVDRLLILIFPF